MSKIKTKLDAKSVRHNIPRHVPPECMHELKQIHNIAVTERFKALQIEANTALVPNGQEYLKTQKAVADLMEQVEKQYVAQMVIALGYASGTSVTIDHKNGEIAVVETANVNTIPKNEPGSN